MSKSKVLQGWVAVVLLWSSHGELCSALDCADSEFGGSRCPISVERLLDRAIQLAELISRVSEESRMLFGDMFIPLTMQSQGHMCAPQIVPIPTSRTEVQQVSDKWLLQSVLILVQFWIHPLTELQASLDHYDNAPSALLDKTKWMLTKLMNLEQGMLVVTERMLEAGSLQLENNDTIMELTLPQDRVESVLRDYTLLTCFKKDAHKIETFLKYLKCRLTNKLRCSFF